MDAKVTWKGLLAFEAVGNSDLPVMMDSNSDPSVRRGPGPMEMVAMSLAGFADPARLCAPGTWVIQGHATSRIRHVSQTRRLAHAEHRRLRAAAVGESNGLSGV